MTKRSLRAILPVLAALACGAAAAAPAPDAARTAVLSARDGAFEAGGGPVALACADGVPLPDPAAADALAEKLAACGFDMVRLPDVSAPEDAERFDAFAAACAHRGLRLWADALVPALAVPPSPADVSAIDDPATAAAWTNALAEAEANGFDPFLAAPWDPRLESLLQHRLRDWARAFNPATGLRRNEDPAWSLVGFSSGWRNAFLFSAAATNAPVPPALFRMGFLSEWNAWLYNRYGTDAAAAAAGSTLPGESVDEGNVAWFGSPFGAVPSSGVPSARLRDQKLFLQSLYLPHALRLMTYFCDAGGYAADVPSFARWGEGPNLLAALSDVRFAGAPEEGFPTIAFFPADGGADALLEAVSPAGSGKTDLLVFPCGDAPETFAPWARLFRAAALSTNGLFRGFHDVGADRADAAVSVAAVRTHALGTNATLRFPASGAVVRLHALQPGEDPAGLVPDPPEGDGLSVLVWLPPPADEAATNALEAARAAGLEDAGLAFVFAPDAPGCPMNLYVRVLDAATGADRPFGLAVAGSSLRKREWRDLASGAKNKSHRLPRDRVLRLPAAAGQRLLLFPSETVESEILKRIETESP